MIGGLLLQFYFAVIILKWDLGYQFFSWLGDKVQTFLSFTDYGSEFVFGPKFMDHIFAMKVSPKYAKSLHAKSLNSEMH